MFLVIRDRKRSWQVEVEEGFITIYCLAWASQVALVVKNPPANARNVRHRSDPWVRKISRRRAWQPTPVFLPGESHGWRSLVGYDPWGCKETDTA